MSEAKVQCPDTRGQQRAASAQRLRHTHHTGETKNACTVLVGKPLKRRRKQWECNIKTDLKQVVTTGNVLKWFGIVSNGWLCSKIIDF